MKLEKIKFNNKKMLNNLEVDFCDDSGNALNTVVIIGENGAGKTTLLKNIFSAFEYKQSFSVVKKNGGKTFAIYPKEDKKAFKQVEQLRMDGRIDMYAEADYSEGTTTFMWISNKIEEIAEKIYHAEKNRISNSISSIPKHIV